MLRKGLLVASLMALVVVWTTPAGAFVGIYSDRLEVNGEVLGKAINEKEMNSLRGTYMGFNFSVLFEGWWDTLGNYNATLVTGGNTGTAGSIAKASLPEGTQVNIQASVGDLGGSKGIFQITQVPGSGNIVTNNMIVNIQIIQVLGNTIQNLPTLPWH